MPDREVWQQSKVCILGQKVGGWEEEVDQQGQMDPTVPL